MDNSSKQTMLLSVRPRFADAILSGSKTVEVRRRRIGAPGGTSVVIYASSPVMAIVGTARLEKMEVLQIEDAWSMHGHAMGISRQEFDDYLSGSDLAHLLLLADPVPLCDPLQLNDLRRSRKFHPPQSYRYIAESDPMQLRELAAQIV